VEEYFLNWKLGEYFFKRRSEMNINKRFFMSAVFALLLVSPAAFANQCENVKATWYGTGDFFQDPEVCDGFDYCFPGTLTGKPKGEWMFFGSNATEMLDPFGTNFPINIAAGEQHIYTKRGDIYTVSHTLFDYDTAVFTELLVVTGGTGKYEDATGRIVNSTMLPPTEGQPIDFNGPSVLTGYICTP
jgi:hypothetical protein